MRYENIKTGAVVDSPFPIKGDNWIPVDNENKNVTDLSEAESKSLVLELQNKIDELEEENNLIKKELLEAMSTGVNADTEADDSDSDGEEEEVDLEELSNKELEALAKEQGIVLTAEDKKNKANRIAAIVAKLG